MMITDLNSRGLCLIGTGESLIGVKLAENETDHLCPSGGDVWNWRMLACAPCTLSWRGIWSKGQVQLCLYESYNTLWFPDRRLTTLPVSRVDELMLIFKTFNLWRSASGPGGREELCSLRVGLCPRSNYFTWLSQTQDFIHFSDPPFRRAPQLLPPTTYIAGYGTTSANLQIPRPSKYLEIELD
jgi:hypothetical protein